MAGKKSDPKKKAACEAAWKRSQARKERRKADQAARTAANKATKAAGGLTPWEQAKAKRALERSR